MHRSHLYEGDFAFPVGEKNEKRFSRKDAKQQRRKRKRKLYLQNEKMTPNMERRKSLADCDSRFFAARREKEE